MAVLKVVKEFGNVDLILGYVCEHPLGGYWFNPQIPHRKPSRKAWDSPEASIPRWAKNECDRIEKIA